MSLLTSSEEKERDSLLDIQKSRIRYMDQQEFERLRYLSNKMYKLSKNYNSK